MSGRGRPSKYTPEIADEIVHRLSEGEPLRAICRSAGMPHWNTVYDWIDRDEDFSVRIARARDRGADAIAEEALHIADTPEEGVTTRHDKDGTTTTHEDMLGHRKLRVETRLKLLAKWSPKKYGDKQQVEHSGSLTLAQLVEASGLKE